MKPLSTMLRAVPLVLAAMFATASADPSLLDPHSLTKYVDPLPVPGAMPMASENHYEIGVWPIEQQLHSQLPPTHAYGYGVTQATASWPGATIVAQKGVPISVRWTNHLPLHHLLEAAFDPTLMHAVTTTGVPVATHVHGLEVEPQSDGGPMTWFTAGFAERGPAWTKEVLDYPNTQLPATIWYHDHAFGFTRHNVYAGLAGFYVITDPAHEPAGLPGGPYDIGLAIQDRDFTADGQLWYPNQGGNDVHPVWTPEFFGNVILVNGKIWPYLNVEPRRYRFRILDGSNARFYSLALADRATDAPGPAFHQIATDGGYLAAPVTLNDPADPRSPRLLLAPGERAEVVVDFSAYAPGAELVLRNNAKTPYPSGAAVDPQTTGQIMLFRVVAPTGPDPSVLPASLEPVTALGPATLTRTMTLNEELDADDFPLGVFLNGLPFDAEVTERPTLGATEIWEVVNLTADTHPIHLHLVQSQLVDRQKLNVRNYSRAFEAANPDQPGGTYVPVPVAPYLKGKPAPPDPNERGWKDTFRMNPGEVTRIIVRFAPQDDSPAYTFDATAEPGYVWHCHILEHEENDMMRPFHLIAPAMASPPEIIRPAATVVPATRTTLFAPSPNPAVQGATFAFALAQSGRVDLELFSVAGQRVRRIASGEFGAGSHSIAWNGTDDAGRRLAPGLYFVQLRSPDVVTSRKLLVTP